MFFSVDHPFIKVQCEEEEKCTGVMGEGDCMFPSKNLELDLVRIMAGLYNNYNY